MKKLLAMALVAVMALGMAACQKNDVAKEETKQEETKPAVNDTEDVVEEEAEEAKTDEEKIRDVVEGYISANKKEITEYSEKFENVKKFLDPNGDLYLNLEIDQKTMDSAFKTAQIPYGGTREQYKQYWSRLTNVVAKNQSATIKEIEINEETAVVTLEKRAIRDGFKLVIDEGASWDKFVEQAIGQYEEASTYQNKEVTMELRMIDGSWLISKQG